jgi:tetratricopeptide (TPR) repeat protein
MKRSYLWRIMIAAFFVLLQFTACNRGQRTKTPEIPDTPQDREKARLMNDIDRDFEDSESHYKLGQLYQNEGQWSKALNEYNVAVSFNPAHRSAQAATVSVLYAMGDTAKADMTADTYIMQTSGSAEESLRLALAFQKEKLDDLALRAYQQALRLAPNSAKVNRQIGYYYLSKGDKVRAREYLYRSFQLNRKQADVAGELGRLGVDISGARPESAKDADKIITDADKQMANQP